MRDKVVIGAVVGLLADVVKLAVNYLAFQFHFASVVFWQITASRFVDVEELKLPVAIVLGAAADFTMTAVIGIMFVYFLYFTGRDYIWFKGVGFALGIWVLLFGTLLAQSSVKAVLKPSDYAVTLVAHFVYGLALALMAKRFYHSPVRPV